MAKVKLTKNVRKQLESILRAAEMQKAGFNKPSKLPSAQDYTDEVVEATRLYRETWIIEPLQELLDADKEGQDDIFLSYVTFPF